MDFTGYHGMKKRDVVGCLMMFDVRKLNIELYPRPPQAPNSARKLAKTVPKRVVDD